MNKAHSNMLFVSGLRCYRFRKPSAANFAAISYSRNQNTFQNQGSNCQPVLAYTQLCQFHHHLITTRRITTYRAKWTQTNNPESSLFRSKNITSPTRFSQIHLPRVFFAAILPSGLSTGQCLNHNVTVKSRSRAANNAWPN